MNINIRGDNTTFTTGNNSPIISKKSNTKKNEKIYEKWWFISFLLGCIGGIVIGLNLHSLIIGLISILVIGLTLLFFNPKRRFMRIGIIILSMGSLNLLPTITGLFTISKDNFIIFEQNTSSIFGIVLIILSGYLFYLDSKQK